MLTSSVWRPNIPRDPADVGYGALTVRFSHRQRVFGFDVEPINPEQNAAPILRVNFFNHDGEQLGQALVLNGFDRFTFLLAHPLPEVSGATIQNISAHPFALDNVVFEIPLLIGNACCLLADTQVLGSVG